MISPIEFVYQRNKTTKKKKRQWDIPRQREGGEKASAVEVESAERASTKRGERDSVEERGNFGLMVERQCTVNGVRKPVGFFCVCVSEAIVRRQGQRVCLPDFSILICVISIRCRFIFLFFFLFFNFPKAKRRRFGVMINFFI